MAGRTTEDVKHELESERERLGDAVHTLRSQAGRARRKLPLVAAALAAAGVAVGVVRKRLSRT
jgi:chaperonin cofactor prefoldin